MSRWFRFYDEVVDDPKVQRLSPELFRAWVNLLCLASKNEGVLPVIEDIAFKLRVSVERADKILQALVDCELVDCNATGARPHNWNCRQYKSDVSTERVKQYRKRKRNVSSSVSETPPDTEAETDTEANASDAGASDVRTTLFRDGLSTLARITGKTPDSCRSLLGRWLKSVDDEAIHVLGAIQDAERNRIADPVPWINRVLNSRGKQDAGQDRSLSGIARAAAERAAALASGSGIRDDGGGTPFRLISQRQGT